MSNLNNTDIFGNLTVLNNNTINDKLTVNGEIYGLNQYIFSGYTESHLHWDKYLTSSPTGNVDYNDSWYVTGEGGWGYGLLSKKRFRREDGLTLEFEVCCTGGYNLMVGFVDGNSTTFGFQQTPANCFYFNYTINTYIYENGGNNFQCTSPCQPTDRYVRFRMIMNNSNNIYQWLNGVNWETIYTSTVNTTKYLRVMLDCYGGTLYFKNMRVFQQSTILNGDRGIFSGGAVLGTSYNTIDYITISTTGNASDFGDLTQTVNAPSSCSNGVNGRGTRGGGVMPGTINVSNIDYVNINIMGNSVYFGTLTVARCALKGASNNINNRGVYSGGYSDQYLTIIDYINIPTVGNAGSFGVLTIARYGSGTCSNGNNNRSCMCGGVNSGGTLSSMDYVTISTEGNAGSFGSLLAVRQNTTACSNFTNNRGLIGGGTPTYLATIEYITINTTGNSISFASLTQGRDVLESTSNGINNRGVFAGGSISGGNSNVIDYTNIISLVNAIDFGDLTVTRQWPSGCSNAN
jgi:hypothetical protein